MNNSQRALVYASQRGRTGSLREGLERQTVRDLKAIAKAEGVTVPSKARKKEIIDLLNGANQVVDIDKLTPKQRKRLRNKQNRELHR